MSTVARPSPGQPGRARARRILLIGGNPDLLSLVRHLVGTGLPEARLYVDDGAADWMASSSPLRKMDLLILDLGAGDERHMQRLQRLSALPGAPPVLAISAFDDSATLRRALECGARAYLGRQEMSVGTFAERIRSALVQSQAADSGERTRPVEPNRAPRASAIDDRTAAQHRTLHREGNDSVPHVPGYSILHPVGQGGMATVYLARADGDGRQVILKVLFVDEDCNETVLRRFLREFRIAARLEHPNIVRIHERAFASDFAYIAMEYCSGGDLSTRIRSGMDRDTAVQAVRTIASALHVAHQAGVIHRDVKPANVLFRADGSIALTDFGIAKAREAAVSLTMTNAMVGTPHYISPEQIRGVELDQRADIYSLGVMFFEMLTGRRPYVANRLMKLLEAHVAAPVPALPDLLADLQPVLDRMMAKRPDDRYQSVPELLTDLA